MNENIRDKDAVRRAFRCAFKAFPANSPSVPNKNVSTGILEKICFALNCQVEDIMEITDSEDGVKREEK